MEERRSSHVAEVPAGKVWEAGLTRHTPVFFTTHGVGQLVLSGTLILDTHREMVTVRVRVFAFRAVGSINAPQPTEPGGVQAVADRPIIRSRHARQVLRSYPVRINARTVRIADVRKNIE